MRKGGAGLGMEAGARAAVLGASLRLRLGWRREEGWRQRGREEGEDRTQPRKGPSLERVRRLSPGTLI